MDTDLELERYQRDAYNHFLSDDVNSSDDLSSSDSSLFACLPRYDTLLQSASSIRDALCFRLPQQPDINTPIEMIMRSFKNLQEEVKTLQEENNKLAGELSDRQHNYPAMQAKLVNEIEQLTNLVVEIRDQLSDASDEITILLNDNDQLTAKYDELSTLYDELTDVYGTQDELLTATMNQLTLSNQECKVLLDDNRKLAMCIEHTLKKGTIEYNLDAY